MAVQFRPAPLCNQIMTKKHWNKLKSDLTIEAEKRNRNKLKKQRKPVDLDEMERLETEDWIGDIERREYEKSEKYLKGKELAEKYKNGDA